MLTSHLLATSDPSPLQAQLTVCHVDAAKSPAPSDNMADETLNSVLRNVINEVRDLFRCSRGWVAPDDQLAEALHDCSSSMATLR